jgi:hypothetical protein
LSYVARVPSSARLEREEEAGDRQHDCFGARRPVGPPVAAADRAVLREVALAYRRRLRMAGSSAAIAREGALAHHLELRRVARADRLGASARVAQLIVSAVAADPRWFWRGLDA